MQSQERYRCIFALIFVLFGATIGAWTWYQFSGIQGAEHVSARTGSSLFIRARKVQETQERLTIRNLHIGARLLIPTIGVNAPLEPVGILVNGALAVPTHNQWITAGWYRYGPFPGEQGSAVVDGHLDRPGGYPAVFWHLHDLRTGDDVIVIDNNGKALHFRVLRLATYPPNTAPLNAIFGNGKGLFLNLITCAGRWIPAEHQTSLRLVVYTRLVA